MFASVWVRSARNRPSSSRASSIFVTWSRPCASETKASDRRRGPFDRAADRLGGEGDEGLLGVVEDLRAEAAADVRGDDAQLVLGDAEHEGAHQQPDDVRVLRGGPERVLVVAGVVLADRGPRLHGVRHQPVVDELERRDVWRGADRLVGRGGVVVEEAPVEAEVGAGIVVDQRRLGVEGGAHVDDRGQLLDVELDRLGGVARLGQRLGDHRGDRIADVADLALGEDRVLRLLHRLAVAVGDQPAAGDAADALEVLRGEDLEHARHRLGRARCRCLRMRPCATSERRKCT